MHVLDVICKGWLPDQDLDGLLDRVAGGRAECHLWRPLPAAWPLQPWTPAIPPFKFNKYIHKQKVNCPNDISIGSP